MVKVRAGYSMIKVRAGYSMIGAGRLLYDWCGPAVLPLMAGRLYFR